jgi:hypothetical protein
MGKEEKKEKHKIVKGDKGKSHDITLHDIT